MTDPALARARALLSEAGLPYPADLDAELVPTPGASSRSFHLVARDGVRLAVDLHLPASTAPVTTVIRSTRYWRATVGSAVKEHLGALEAARWTALGFALLLVDARGTGASYGTWLRGWDEAQRQDLVDIVDWVVAQPWSDGKVGGYGTSYDGTTAHLLASTGHPAVRAVVPRFALFDGYHHIAAPGGVPLDGFVEPWASLNHHLDGHPTRATTPPPVPVVGVPRPVDADVDGTLLAEAQAEHAGNWDLWGSAEEAWHRLDPLPDGGQGTPFARLPELHRSRVPMWLWSGWYDGAYAAAQLAQLADPDLDVLVTIGPFAHGAAFPPFGDPLRPGLDNQPMAEQVAEIAAFLRDPGAARPALRYWRLGDGWHDSPCWPPAGSEPVRLALAGDGVLGGTDEEPREYDVDFTASSGTAGTRWHTLLGGTPVEYPDRRTADERLLVWDGPVLDVPTGVTGTAVVHLEAVADADDLAVHAYLEAVDPEGRVLYLTEGQLRALHRAPGAGPAPYATFGPWHSYDKADATPVLPGEPFVLDFPMWPISALVPAGWRLRVALAGADAPLFRRVPERGDVRLKVLAGSWVELPLEVT